MKLNAAIAVAILSATTYAVALPDPGCRFVGQPCKREADAEPGFSSGQRKFVGQPVKREAEPETEAEPAPAVYKRDPKAEAEAFAKAWCRFVGQPC
ncbi:hypothetical protein DM02DRAFT_614486 [Periconia macrospinosa]|uniref:Uncharacterized protein n=1 Tax=Periconia macrospinosa TaxID=97972 RepID=A0A2V1DQX0_9PLEO|nr:hypothetical protein DM02DRAFT_614486 [Periconia macrospinosa]